MAFERSDGTIRYYKADALGSIVSLTDGNGVVTTTYAYDAFGNVILSGSDNNSFQYTGRENDRTGLYYYRERYYNPAMRRFISEDPIVIFGGINFYVYVQNNPMNLVDPDGLRGRAPRPRFPRWPKRTPGKIMDKMTDLEMTDTNYVISFELKCVDVYCPPSGPSPDNSSCSNKDEKKDKGPWFVNPNNDCYCREWKVVPVMR